MQLNLTHMRPKMTLNLNVRDRNGSLCGNVCKSCNRTRMRIRKSEYYKTKRNICSKPHQERKRARAECTRYTFSTYHYLMNTFDAHSYEMSNYFESASFTKTTATTT